MKLSPTFYIITGIALVCFVPAYLAMRSDSAALEAQAGEASKGLSGYATPEEEAAKRMAAFQGELEQVRSAAEKEIETLKHEHEMWKLQRELAQAKADNEAAQKRREQSKLVKP